MSKKYNINITKNIFKLIDDKEWNQVLNELSIYVNEYNKDYLMLVVYANNLLKFGRIEEAGAILAQIKKEDITFYNTIKKYHFTYIRYLLLAQKYQECLDYIMHHRVAFRDQNDCFYIIGYCQQQLKGNAEPNGYTGYVYNQVLNYREEDTKDYLSNLTVDKDNSKSQFNPEFPVLEAYEIVKKLMDESSKFYFGTILAESVFKVPNCGNIHEKKLDYITVESIIHTNNIVLMFPSDNPNKLDYIDLSGEKKLSLSNGINC